MRQKKSLRIRDFCDVTNVNQRHIVGVNGYTLMLMGGEELQISRPRKKAFMSELAEAMGRDNVL